MHDPDCSRARRRPGAVVALGLAFVVTGCAQLPHDHIVKGPTNARPPAPKPENQTDGSIFESAYSKPLFSDRRPRHVGDILTVVFNEDLSATKNSSAKANRNGSVSLTAKTVPQVLGSLLDNQNADISGKNGFDSGGGASASNTFTGRMTTTVREVLPNGNLVIAGEKRIGINQGSEYVRFSGTVNPRMISAQSTITSNKVANVRLSYYGDGYIDEAQHMGWLQRLFFNLSPL